MKLGAVIWDAGLPSSILTLAPNTHPFACSLRSARPHPRVRGQDSCLIPASYVFHFLSPGFRISAAFREGHWALPSRAPEAPVPVPLAPCASSPSLIACPGSPRPLLALITSACFGHCSLHSHLPRPTPAPGMLSGLDSLCGCFAHFNLQLSVTPTASCGRRLKRSRSCLRSPGPPPGLPPCLVLYVVKAIRYQRPQLAFFPLKFCRMLLLPLFPSLPQDPTDPPSPPKAISLLCLGHTHACLPELFCTLYTCARSLSGSTFLSFDINCLGGFPILKPLPWMLILREIISRALCRAVLLCGPRELLAGRPLHVGEC